MKVRERMLPPGWYPDEKEEVLEEIAGWKRLERRLSTPAVACIVPHAGWYFSGELAFMGIRSLDPEAEVVAVVGGHLSERSPLLYMPEDGLSTPLGDLPVERPLVETLREHVPTEPDVYPDNTVEIQLPLVKYCFPHASVVGLRCPPLLEVAERTARVLYDYGKETGKKPVVIGSTDLTHYGPQYGFTPVGVGRQAEEWVRFSNDQAIIEAFTSLDTARALDLALTRSAACSCGGAAVAMEYARLCGREKGTLLAYMQSSEKHPSRSFVGYAAVAF
ncbi:AmmeMemoRadiSam system protein B [Spirochaeta thermophila]|nr:AmmeMemoRadiSam system protein B [Spirochaeta thermophila]